jgi:hypothetical protein
LTSKGRAQNHEARALIIVGAVVTAGIAIEKFYEHPTLGGGLQAFIGAINLGKFF